MDFIPFQAIPYDQIITSLPWIVSRGQSCILSPDSDGLLCGLLMSHYLDWRVCGYYDGKVMIIAHDVQPADCVFLDMEIFRSHVRSVGQHMIRYNRKKPTLHEQQLQQCLNANDLRAFDAKHNFKTKYPFGTVHLLLALLSTHQSVEIPLSAVATLLYTDGVFKNLFNYPENCLEWLHVLDADRVSPLMHTFLDPHYSVHELMLELRRLFEEISHLNSGKRGGDKIQLSDSNGRLSILDTSHQMHAPQKQMAENFLRMLAENTRWKYNSSLWHWELFSGIEFKKEMTKPGLARYAEMMKKQPISLAMTSGERIEYTLDPDGFLMEPL